MKHHFQLSVRELMLLVFVTGLGLAGLCTGGWIASLGVLMLTTVAMALGIVAVVGHGHDRLFAIGFLIPLMIYMGVHAYVGPTELDAYGKLPTTRLIQPIYELLVRVEYIDSNTGKAIPNYDPTKNPGLGGGGAAPPVTLKVIPDRETFMTLAHALFAVTLAYIGGKFAVWVAGRPPRTSDCDEQSDARETSAQSVLNSSSTPRSL